MRSGHSLNALRTLTDFIYRSSVRRAMRHSYGMRAVFGINVDPAQRIAPKLCQWSAPNQPNSMNAKKVAITLVDARAFGYAKTPITKSVTTTPASGIGDDAVYSSLPGVTPGLGTTLNVKKVWDASSAPSRPAAT